MRSKPSIAKTIRSASKHANNRKCCESVHWPMKQPAKSKKGFEAARLGVFAIPGPLLTHLNPGSMDQFSVGGKLSVA